MNFKKVRLGSGKSALVNFDNVCEIHRRFSGGCDIYFVTMGSKEEQSYIQVDNTPEELEAILVKEVKE